MANRTKYEKLDEIGVVGLQEQESAASLKYQQVKTGEIFRKARAAATKNSSVKRRSSKSSV